MTAEHDQTSDQLDPILLQAIDWMVCLESGLATLAEQQAFQDWLQQDIRHQQAWHSLEQSMDLPFQQLQQCSRAAELPVAAMTQTVLQPKQRQLKALLKGGGALFCLGLLVSMVWLQQSRPLSFIQADYYTKTAEQKQIRLQDGSEITLAPYSAIQVDYNASQRHIYILEGALIAKVAADRNRPFVVQTKQAAMQALGTEFMVQQHGQYSDLAVLEHRVKASNSHQSKAVFEGQSVRVDADKIEKLAMKAQDLASWKDGVLQVEDMTLAEFIERIKPHHQGYIYLSDEVKHIKVYGVFYLTDTNKILEILESTHPIRIRKSHLGWIVIQSK
ncbi:FecR family protein [Acinetobacter larvae]|uniref:Histidine kinase n=1 Tax=Acinetobacter larvae TaxID=1789224 RepID=A0A1B2M0X6_9GAMM|nr:FecR family protein [Acinetobacter larvae]AOA58854.1 hypothetical protein BFG52_11145 [Acinetobacter larvae]